MAELVDHRNRIRHSPFAHLPERPAPTYGMEWERQIPMLMLAGTKFCESGLGSYRVSHASPRPQKLVRTQMSISDRLALLDNLSEGKTILTLRRYKTIE